MMTEREIEEEDRVRSVELRDMVETLLGKPTGRPRDAVSTYCLPLAAIRLLDCGYTAMSMPRKLRPVAKIMLRATKRKKGPKLPLWLRNRNLANGNYAPETVRRIEWLKRKESEREKIRQSLEPTAEKLEEYRRSMPKPGTDAFSLMAVLAARRWLV
ncbi:MAG: hypothetical protein B7X90_02860 [Novosphingobium sp. 17-62-19]|nr:MAG: hypothetical protein B7X90_02860 [Novosphingobium sp. 17-62-19]